MKTFDKALSELLTKFGGLNYKHYDKASMLSTIKNDLTPVQKDLKGADKMVCTKFLNKVAKCQTMEQMLLLISEQMLKLENLGKEDE